MARVLADKASKSSVVPTKGDAQSKGEIADIVLPAVTLVDDENVVCDMSEVRARSKAQNRNASGSLINGISSIEQQRNLKFYRELVGAEVGSSYLVEEYLRSDDLGPVYRAVQKATGRSVSIRVLHPHLVGDAVELISNLPNKNAQRGEGEVRGEGKGPDTNPLQFQAEKFTAAERPRKILGLEKSDILAFISIILAAAFIFFVYKAAQWAASPGIEGYLSDSERAEQGSLDGEALDLSGAPDLQPSQVAAVPVGFSLEKARAETSHQRGLNFFLRGDYLRAGLLFKKASKLDRTRASSRVYWGICLMKLGYVGRAKGQFVRAVELEPENALAYYYLALAELHEGNRDAAVLSLNKAVTLDVDLVAEVKSEPLFADIREQVKF